MTLQGTAFGCISPDDRQEHNLKVTKCNTSPCLRETLDKAISSTVAVPPFHAYGGYGTDNPKQCKNKSDKKQGSNFQKVAVVKKYTANRTENFYKIYFLQKCAALGSVSICQVSTWFWVQSTLLKDTQQPL